MSGDSDQRIAGLPAPDARPPDACVLIYLPNDEAPVDQDFALIGQHKPDERNPEGWWPPPDAIDYAAWSVRHPEKTPWLLLADGTILGLEEIRAEWKRRHR